MDREIYNAYKSIVTKNGENVKDNIIKYMKQVINDETPNAETIETIKEVQKMKTDPTIGKTYTSFDEIIKELLDE